jgi:hypothetical protein
MQVDALRTLTNDHGVSSNLQAVDAHPSEVASDINTPNNRWSRFKAWITAVEESHRYKQLDLCQSAPTNKSRDPPGHVQIEDAREIIPQKVCKCNSAKS